MRARMINGWMPFVAVAAHAAAVDLVSKAWIFGRLGMPGSSPPIVLVPRFLALETNLNEGALFGMGQGMGSVFAAVSVLAIIGIVALVSRPATRCDRWLLVALDGKKLDRRSLPRLLAGIKPGQEMDLHVFRLGVLRCIRVRFGSALVERYAIRPDPDASPQVFALARGWLGVERKKKP